MMMSDLPLSGVRVADLSWIIAGPTSTRFLAMMGAEVIKMGSERRPDPSTRGAAFQTYNQSKLYGALNISKPEGLELVKRLIAISDVVIENFAVGVIERLGLDYATVSAERPDIIMVSSSGTGHTGPDKDYVAYGSLLQHYTGWNSISGYPDQEPIKGGLWADPWVGMELAMITAAALNHRAVTGEGQYVDFSMAEALSASIPEAILDYQMNGSMREPMGNNDDYYAPHGVYRCKGPDRWVAIAVTDEDEWRALCGAIGKTSLTIDPEYATVEGRIKHREELDGFITYWTSRHNDYEVMRVLQEWGIPCGPSLDIGRTYNNRQIKHGGYLTSLQTSDGVQRNLPTLPWRFEDTPDPYVTAAPVLGQHNDYIYRELLGLTQEEIAGFVKEQVIF